MALAKSNVFPAFSGLGVLDRNPSHSKSFGKRVDALVTLPNFKNVFLGQLRLRKLLTFLLSSFGNHVRGVVCFRPKEEVIWIDAVGNVALVKNA